MADKTKIGRRATADDRQIAAKWVALYRKAQASPDGSHCVNPDDPWEERTYLYADDVDFLLSMLTDFSKNGTFKNPTSPLSKNFSIQHEFNALRESGLTYQAAIETMAERHPWSTRTIERRLADKT